MTDSTETSIVSDVASTQAFQKAVDGRGYEKFIEALQKTLRASIKDLNCHLPDKDHFTAGKSLDIATGEPTEKFSVGEHRYEDGILGMRRLVNVLSIEKGEGGEVKLSGSDLDGGEQTFSLEQESIDKISKIVTAHLLERLPEQTQETVLAASQKVADAAPTFDSGTSP